MSSRRTWIGLAAAAALIAIIIVLGGATGPGDSPEHRSSSDAPNGTSALFAYAQALGHSTGSVEGSFHLPASSALLFVFTPGGFSAAETQQVSSWVSAGGVLVYAAEAGDPQLDAQFAIQRRRDAAPATATAPAPILGGVGRVTGAATAVPFTPAAAQVPLLRNDRSDILAVVSHIGQGQVIALADPLELCNGYLDQADNGRLAADLIALAPGTGRVLFDEFHHGAVAGSSSLADWMLTPWGIALVWLVAVIFLGLALRGRAFGPPIPLVATTERSSAEYATAVGDLLRRARARQVTLQTLDAAARRALSERIGLSLHIESAHFTDVAVQRAPAAARDLASVESQLPAAARSEETLLQAARQLHTIAYPRAAQPAGKEPS